MPNKRIDPKLIIAVAEIAEKRAASDGERQLARLLRVQVQPAKAPKRGRKQDLASEQQEQLWEYVTACTMRGMSVEQALKKAASFRRIVRVIQGDTEDNPPLYVEYGKRFDAGRKVLRKALEKASERLTPGNATIKRASRREGEK